MANINLVGIINCMVSLRVTRGREPLAFSLTTPWSGHIYSWQASDMAHYNSRKLCLPEIGWASEYAVMCFCDCVMLHGKDGEGSQN